jgi:hypothetical protein
MSVFSRRPATAVLVLAVSLVASLTHRGRSRSRVRLVGEIVVGLLIGVNDPINGWKIVSPRAASARSFQRFVSRTDPMGQSDSTGVRRAGGYHASGWSAEKSVSFNRPPPRLAEAKQRLLDLEGKRGQRFRDASVEDGVHEPSHKARGAARRVLRRLRSALAHRK